MTINYSFDHSTRLVPEFGVGDRLRKARELKGLSQGGFGALVGLSHKVIGNMERGTTPIDGLQIYGWAEICDIDPLWIKTGEGSPRPDPQGPDGGIPNNVHSINRTVTESKDCQSLARLRIKPLILQPIAARHNSLAQSGNQNGWTGNVNVQTFNLKMAA